jgi:DNA-binding MarR family transcriptional regulator
MLTENLERNFGFLVNDVARLLRTAYDRRVGSLGLTRSQWWVLTHLYRNEGVTQTELADVLELERPSLGRLLDRLEANGWVTRRQCPADRRAKRVYLTAEVRPAMRRMRSIAAQLREDALIGLDDVSREQLIDTLLCIKANLTGLDGPGTRAGGNGK